MTDDAYTVTNQMMNAVDLLCDVGFSAGGFDLNVTEYGSYNLVDLKNGEGDSVSMPAVEFLNFLRELKGEIGDERLPATELWKRLKDYQQ